MSIDSTLITFKAISDFVNDLGDCFSDEQKSLKLYQHLINKTTLSDEVPIKKHIEAFTNFCLENKESIYEKKLGLLKTPIIAYSEKVKINIKEILLNSSSFDIKDTIWKHLLFISSLIDPNGKAKHLIQKAREKEDDPESKFLSGVLSKVDDMEISGNNPMEAISSIMGSGLIGQMMEEMNSGKLDLSKLMGSVQGILDENVKDGDVDMSMMAPLMSMLGNGGMGGMPGMPGMGGGGGNNLLEDNSNPDDLD